MRIKHALITLLLALVALPVIAEERGIYPTRTFDLRLMNLGDRFAEPPFRALAQSPNGLIYLGDDAGLIEFDGQDWRRVPVTQNRPITVIGVTRDGRLVLGGSEYLIVLSDPNRPQEALNLSTRFPTEFDGAGEFWEFAEDDERWCVRSMAVLVCQAGAQFEFFRPQRSYGRLFQGQNQILLQVDGQGLARVGARGPELIKGGAGFLDAPIMSLSQDIDGEYLALTRNSDRATTTWRWREGEPPSRQTGGLASGLSDSVGIGVLVYPGRFAVPEDNGGVAILGKQGQVLDRIDPSDLGVGSGAQVVMVDQEGALWIAWPTAISRVEYPSRMSLFMFPSSFYGGVLNVTRTEPGISVFNGNEVLSLVEDRDGRWRFQDRSRPGMTEILAHASINGTEYFGTTQGFWWGDADQAFSPETLVFAIAPVLDRPDELWLGIRRGFGKIRRIGGGWQWISRRTDLPFDTVQLVQQDANVLWLNTQTGRLVRVAMSDPDRIELATTDELRVAKDGQELFPSIEKAGDRIIFWVGGHGVYDVLDSKLVPSQTIPFSETGALRDIEIVDDNQILISAKDRDLALVKRDAGGVFRYSPSVFDQVAGVGRVRRLFADVSGIFWMVTESGLVRIDPTTESLTPAPQVVQIRHIQVNGEPKTNVLDEQEPLIAPEGSNLRLEFALPSYRAPDLNRFRSRIQQIGEVPEWSPWTNDGRRDFTNLPAGELVFEVEAQDSAGNPGGKASVAILVVAPWYKRTVSIAGFIVLGAMLLLLGVQWRVRALRARSAELERLVAIKTEALQIAATTDPLTGLWNRHRFGQWMRDEVPKINAQAGAADDDERVDLIACVIDLDHFKRVNDQHGHAAGDAVLKAVAERLLALRENGDLVFRFGGEEFVYLGVNRHRLEGKKLAEKIVHEIAQINVELDSGVLLDPTASVGWSVYPIYREKPELFTLDFVLGVADRALYLAKQVGRNRAYGYVANISVDELDRTQADWRAQVFNRHTDFLKRV
ncbi:hypothetical protein C7S18_02315 [Ahniella affigens]|uniref:diguanylate cyclase n=1 Tax=Ahniella affigens TaxID=2021234 RepID=A0A2P1PMN1_9GAMM|nr:GGDEF domain-containing protein [Ahniella affigens]AVP96098.1 hypothetical protein C7S18_02315 [Ahniella affigens]